MKENYTHPSNYCPDCHRLYCTCPVVETCHACGVEDDGAHTCE